MDIPKWKTKKGELISYSELTDEHLKNILNDGYRNFHLKEEAAKRNISVPTRPVDLLTYDEVCVYLESFASCAIEGNAVGEYMMKLWNTGQADLFYFRLNEFLKIEAKFKK